MNQYLEKARLIKSQFKSLKIHALKKELNAKADALANSVAYKAYDKKSSVSLRDNVHEKEVEESVREVNMIDFTKEPKEEQCWMKEIVDFLQDFVLPEDKSK